MNEENTVRAIRGLTISVWALVITLVLKALFTYLWSYMAVGIVSGEKTTFSVETEKKSEPGYPVKFTNPYKEFHDWPIEKQIAEASAIVLTKYSNDGEKLTSTVSEVIKLVPGTTFYYKVGDKLQNGTRYLKSDITYGEGEIVLFTGSPAQERISASYSEGRCGGLGGISIEQLKEMIATQNQKTPKKSLKDAP